MTNSRSLLSIALLASTLATGCASGDGTANLATGSSGSAAKSSLSLMQVDAVTAAAREMAADTAAQVHGLKSHTTAGAPGIHICGYVKTATKASTPLYVELRGKDGTFTAERGQIGATPANLAKVRFMCRDHGEW